MSKKWAFPGALLLSLAAVCTAPAQEIPDTLTKPDETKAIEASGATPIAYPPNTGLSSWITYNCPDCCGPIGGDGPIAWEINIRSGPSFPVSGGYIAKGTTMGWLVEGIGRGLLFNQAEDAAWAFDIGLRHTENHGGHPNLTNVLETKTVSLARLHRTGMSLGAGREVWLVGGARTEGTGWRLGADAGLHWDSLRVDLHDYNEFLSQYRRLGGQGFGTYLGLHTDMEVPIGCCTIVTGVRAEWNYSRLHVAPRFERGEMHDINLMGTLGVRY